MEKDARAALSKPTCSLDQVAALLSLSRQSVVDAIERGDIDARKFGRKWIIPTAPLRRMLRVDDTAVLQADAA
ncbi:hypothetical protein MBRA_06334 [Methylobacterium brachiatum]|nr:hypothetical protein MBRA_06334 [Methylobacterium brachiatum]